MTTPRTFRYSRKLSVGGGYAGRGRRRGSPPPRQARRERLQQLACLAAGASRRWRIDVEGRPTMIDRNDNKRLIGRAGVVLRGQSSA